MKACLAIWMTALALAPLASGEIVEEETWYNAEGTVVKKVKRVVTGADAKANPDWEPAWVMREESRKVGSRISYGATRVRVHRGYRRGAGYYYGSRPLRCGSSYYYGSRRVTRGGVFGYYNGSGRGSQWGVGYRGPGVSILYRH